MNRILIAAAVLLALHLIPLFTRPVSDWGVDMLAYLSPGATAGFIAAGLLLIVPYSRRRLLLWGQSVAGFADPWKPGPGSFAWRGIILVLAGFLFVTLRSSIHLLGDGYLYIRELEAGAWEGIARMDRAPLTFWLIRHLHSLGSTLWDSAETTYRIYSITSGVLYVFLTLILSGKLGSKPSERWLIFGFLITAGYMQLFFGYVENYSLVFAGALLYLYLGIRDIRGETPWWLSPVILGVLASLHFVLAFLLPSVVLIPFLASGRGSWTGAARRALAAALLSGAVWAAILVLVGFDFGFYLESMRGSNWLPLLGEPEMHQHYRLVSLDHFIDVVNQFLLVAPALLLTLFIGRPPPSPDLRFLAAAAVPPVLFLLLVNPEIGVYRDWDLLSLAAIPLLAWSGLALIRRGPPRLAETALLICGVSALHTLAWIGVNASPSRAEARYVHVLETGALSIHARAYGWETLGAYFNTGGRKAQALDAYAKSAESSPGNARLWNSAASLYHEQGQDQKAMTLFLKALALNPESALTHYNLGVLYYERREPQKAIEHSAEAIRLQPNYPEAHNNLANVYRNLNQPEAAVPHYLRAIELSPDYADVYYNLGGTLHSMGRVEEAKRYLARFLELKPNSPQAVKARRALEAKP